MPGRFLAMRRLSKQFYFSHPRLENLANIYYLIKAEANETYGIRTARPVILPFNKSCNA